MALDLKQLSIPEIRARYLGSDAPVTPHLLRALKRDAREGVRRLHGVLARRYEEARRERERLDAMLNFERLLWRSGVGRIAGVDEVGIGPLAGPVVAAAVVFEQDACIEGVDDSKRLDPAARTELAAAIRANALAIGIGMASVEEIDRLNVYQAGLLAMRRAVEALPVAPQHILVDARRIPDVAIPQNPFNKGDGINFSIAAASIVAKTYRDGLMEQCHGDYPEYGFCRHKGYGTREHQAAIRRFGPCALHRMSYPFIRELRGQYSPTFYRIKQQLARAGTAAKLEALERRLVRAGASLSEHERRKLKLVMARRWKVL